jgi:hypothetical protein
MIPTKHQKPIVKPVQQIQGVDVTNPKPIPEFGIEGYVQAMREKDRRKMKSTRTPSTSADSSTPTWQTNHPSASSQHLSGCNIFNINDCHWKI